MVWKREREDKGIGLVGGRGARGVGGRGVDLSSQRPCAEAKLAKARTGAADRSQDRAFHPPLILHRGLDLIFSSKRRAIQLGQAGEAKVQCLAQAIDTCTHKQDERTSQLQLAQLRERQKDRGD